MGGYRLLFKPSAERAFLALPRDIQKRLDKRLLALRDNPRPPGVKALTGACPASSAFGLETTASSTRSTTRC